MASAAIAYDVVRARGHPLVRATHRSTFEITTEGSLTPRGDCIIAVAADKSARALAPEFKQLASRDDARILIVMKSGSAVEIVRARGASSLTFEDPVSMVVRRSNYVDGRTIAIMSDKAAAHLSRELVTRLREGAKLLVVLVAYTHHREGEALELARKVIGAACAS